MNKKVVIGIIVILILGIAAFALLKPKSNSSESLETQLTLSQEDKLANFGAEIYCAEYDYTVSLESASAEEAEVLRGQYFNQTFSLLDKYGYTQADLVNITQAYDNDFSYAEKALDKIRELCPEASQQFEDTLRAIESGQIETD